STDYIKRMQNKMPPDHSAYCSLQFCPMLPLSNDLLITTSAYGICHFISTFGSLKEDNFGCFGSCKSFATTGCLSQKSALHPETPNNKPAMKTASNPLLIHCSQSQGSSIGCLASVYNSGLWLSVREFKSELSRRDRGVK
ncbi:hypothetical protein L9F63_006108, partial [Diploptera punctata]